MPYAKPDGRAQAVGALHAGTHVPAVCQRVSCCGYQVFSFGSVSTQIARGALLSALWIVDLVEALVACSGAGQGR
jgi:hypothetical protein